MKREIVLDSDPRIRQVSTPVDIKEIGTPLFKSLCTDLIDTLNEYRYGVAISAIQIGIPNRIFVIQRSDREGNREIPRIYINPKIVDTSEKSVKQYEACLSVNYAKTFGEVLRKYWVRISYVDIDGNECIHKYDGVDGRIILHELDHLDGKLFTDIVDTDTVKGLEEYLEYIKKCKTAPGD